MAPHHSDWDCGEDEDEMEKYADEYTDEVIDQLTMAMMEQCEISDQWLSKQHGVTDPAILFKQLKHLCVCIPSVARTVHSLYDDFRFNAETVNVYGEVGLPLDVWCEWSEILTAHRSSWMDMTPGDDDGDINVLSAYDSVPREVRDSCGVTDNCGAPVQEHVSASDANAPNTVVGASLDFVTAQSACERTAATAFDVSNGISPTSRADLKCPSKSLVSAPVQENTVVGASLNPVQDHVVADVCVAATVQDKVAGYKPTKNCGRGDKPAQEGGCVDKPDQDGGRGGKHTREESWRGDKPAQDGGRNDKHVQKIGCYDKLAQEDGRGDKPAQDCGRGDKCTRVESWRGDELTQVGERGSGVLGGSVRIVVPVNPPPFRGKHGVAKNMVYDTRVSPLNDRIHAQPFLFMQLPSRTCPMLPNTLRSTDNYSCAVFVLCWSMAGCRAILIRLFMSGETVIQMVNSLWWSNCFDANAADVESEPSYPSAAEYVFDAWTDFAVILLLFAWVFKFASLTVPDAPKPTKDSGRGDTHAQEGGCGIKPDQRRWTRRQAHSSRKLARRQTRRSRRWTQRQARSRKWSQRQARSRGVRTRDNKPAQDGGSGDKLAQDGERDNKLAQDGGRSDKHAHEGGRGDKLAQVGKRGSGVFGGTVKIVVAAKPPPFRGKHGVAENMVYHTRVSPLNDRIHAQPFLFMQLPSRTSPMLPNTLRSTDNYSCAVFVSCCSMAGCRANLNRLFMSGETVIRMLNPLWSNCSDANAALWRRPLPLRDKAE